MSSIYILVTYKGASLTSQRLVFPFMLSKLLFGSRIIQSLQRMINQPLVLATKSLIIKKI